MGEMVVVPEQEAVGLRPPSRQSPADGKTRAPCDATGLSGHVTALHLPRFLSRSRRTCSTHYSNQSVPGLEIVGYA